MPEKTIRTIICDDHKAIRTFLNTLFSSQPGFEVVAICSNGKEAITKTLALKPAILLLDINMPLLDGFEVAQLLREKAKDTSIIGISVNNSPEYVRKMIECGAMGYVTKTSDPEEFILAAKQVLKGKKYICKEIKGK
jgi:DNA-binding NarL/FixJ family response regulator